MDKEGGWVKDYDKLLLWVPVQHREALKNGVKLVIGGAERRRKPEVVVAKLFAGSGPQWTDVCSAHAEM